MSSTNAQSVRFSVGIDVADRTARRNYAMVKKGYDTSGGSSFLDRLLAPSSSLSVPPFTQFLFVITSGSSIYVTITKSGATPGTSRWRVNGIMMLTDPSDITTITIENSETVLTTPSESIRIITS